MTKTHARKNMILPPPLHPLQKPTSCGWCGGVGAAYVDPGGMGGWQTPPAITNQKQKLRTCLFLLVFASCFDIVRLINCLNLLIHGLNQLLILFAAS